MKKKLLIRLWIIIAIITIVSFSDWSFAADSEQPLKGVAYWITYFTQIFSRIWVIFARIAWEFLTNKRVYWEILWLDALLWKYRVIVRNIANFCLWLFFTYMVFMALFKKEDIIKNFKNIILWLLIAWVWIQVSRFFTTVVMDVSTVTLVSVWALPSQSISQNSELEEKFTTTLRTYLDENKVSTWRELILFPKNATANGFLEYRAKPIQQWNEISKDEFFDDLLPRHDDVSWPLYYMWISILDSFNISNISVADTGEDGWAQTIIKIIIHWWTTIVYSIEMMVLCVLALLRIFYLWMFITLSPLVILFYCVKKADASGVWGLIDENFKSINKNLNFKSFFINAFKPTIIVLWLSLSVIFAATMKWIILQQQNSAKDLEWVSISSQCTAINACDTSIDSPLFAWVFKNLSKTFMDIILSIITVVLVYQIIKICVGIGKWSDFVSEKLGKLQGNIWDIMASLPIIPVSWYDEAWNRITNHMSIKSALSLPEEKLTRETRKYESQTADQTTEITKVFFGDDGLSATDKRNIKMAWRRQTWWQKLEAKTQVIEDIRKNNKNNSRKWLVLNPNYSDPFWRDEFTFWLNEREENKDYSRFDYKWKKMVEDRIGLNSDKTKRSLEDLFNKPNNAQTYANHFGYTWNYLNFAAIKDLDISQSPSN